MPAQNSVVKVPGGPERSTIEPARGRCLYRIKVEPRDGDGRGDDLGKALVLHVYQDGVEIGTVDFEPTADGARALLDEVRWLEWKTG